MTAASRLPLHRLLRDGRPVESVVCLDGERTLTWRDFSHRAATLAWQIKARPERRWGLCCDHPFDFACALFAVLHSGGSAIIPPNFQSGTLAQLSSAMDAVLDDDTVAAMAGISLPTEATLTFSPLSPTDAVIDLYTSGSSGEPKLVRKSLAQLEAEVLAQETKWGAVMGGAPVVATVPHHHIYGLLFRLLWPLSSGRPFDAQVYVYPEALAQRIASLGTAVVVSSPAHLSRMADLIPLKALAPARLIFSSGGPLPAVAAADFEAALGQAPTEIYGSTETGGIAWRRQSTADAAWTPLPDVTVAMDEDSALRVKSSFLPDANWCRMDDGAEILADGRFLLKGRLDRVVKIEGKRLSLPEVEQRLRQHSWITEAGAVPLQGRRQTVGVVATLSAKGLHQLSVIGKRETVKVLRHHLAIFFEPVLLPRHWRFPANMPVNERGKLTLANLAALFETSDDETLAA